MHESMKSQMREVETEEQDNPRRQSSVQTRKTSVSTACQTDKVSRKVSHAPRRMSVTRENESLQMNTVKNDHFDVSQFTRIPGQFPLETTHLSDHVSDHVS